MTLHNIRVPALNASCVSILILLSAAGLLSRMLWMKRKGRIERLEKKVQQLEQELEAKTAEVSPAEK